MDAGCGRTLGLVQRASLDGRYDAGEGQRIWFWHDPCYGHTPLKELFPNMFACSLSKEEWISNLVISASKVERSWNLQFHRAFHDWELEGVCSLFEILYSKR